MAFRLTASHHAVAIDERAVVLDVDADRYRLLGSPAGSALRALAGGKIDLPICRHLAALGILEPGEGRKGPPEIQPVVRSAIEQPQTHGINLGYPAVAISLLRTIAGLKLLGLRSMLDRAAASAVQPAVHCKALIPFARSYVRQRSRLPLRDICLPDSLNLHRLLAERGLASTLVIGVSLDPFMAHCWVQAGDMVLNDSYDHVRPYTPIVVI